MTVLSKRLSLIADLVDAGSSVCDVGTDHGYLPAFLYLCGKCKSVIATDINEKPLRCAQKNLARLGADGVRLVLCDGLDGLGLKDADTVIIAGMGGEVISGIIDRAPFLRDEAVKLILQPTTSAKDLRLYLSANGFCVRREQAVCENGKIYSVMSVGFCGAPYTLSETEQLIGALVPDCADAREYIKKQYRIISKRAADLASVSHKKEEYEALLQTAERLKEILEG